MEAAHRSDVSALICATFTSCKRETVNGDGLKVQLFVTAKEAAEGNLPVPEGVKKPLFPDTTCRCVSSLVGIAGSSCCCDFTYPIVVLVKTENPPCKAERASVET